MVFPQMRDDFGVTMGDELMSALPQFRPTLDVIEKLAIKDHKDGAILVRYRLLAICEADNAQPSRSQGHPWPDEETFFVRTAVQQCMGHALDGTFRGQTAPREIDNTGNAAHDWIALIGICELLNCFLHYFIRLFSLYT